MVVGPGGPLFAPWLSLSTRQLLPTSGAIDRSHAVSRIGKRQGRKKRGNGGCASSCGFTHSRGRSTEERRVGLEVTGGGCGLTGCWDGRSKGSGDPRQTDGHRRGR